MSDRRWEFIVDDSSVQSEWVAAFVLQGCQTEARIREHPSSSGVARGLTVASQDGDGVSADGGAAGLHALPSFDSLHGPSLESVVKSRRKGDGGGAGSGAGSGSGAGARAGDGDGDGGGGGGSSGGGGGGGDTGNS